MLFYIKYVYPKLYIYFFWNEVYNFSKKEKTNNLNMK